MPGGGLQVDLGGLRSELGQAEVENPRETIVADDNVLGFEIAMDDPRRVGFCHASSDLGMLAGGLVFENAPDFRTLLARCREIEERAVQIR